MKSLELLSSKRRLKRIAPLQLGKIFALLYGIIGIMVMIPAFIIASMAAPTSPGSSEKTLIIFFPVIYAAMGFIFGVLGAAIYNLVAKWVGGILIEVEWDREQG
jgi:hypothetical protein